MEVVHRLFQVLLHPVPGEVHVAQAVLPVRVPHVRRFVEVLERRLVVRRHPEPVGVHVTKIGDGIHVARRRRLLEVVHRARVVLLHPSRPKIEQVTHCRLRVGVAHVGAVLVILEHVPLAPGVVARVVVEAEPHLFHRRKGAALTQLLHHALRRGLVVQHRRLATLRHAVAHQVPETERHLCARQPRARRKVLVQDCSRAAPRGVG
mmetsp:Transcript_4197/g.14618  ORF Transcript_4197/g.14618 Transcript_4197/m.14618 type:complete len:206 (-) Transcript_4197:71-688(-)